jgi:RNA-binding protein YlmH
MHGEDKELLWLFAHGRELLERAEKGEITATAFLTPREGLRLSAHLAYARQSLLLYGGYGGAERCRMLFLPDYVQEADPDLRASLLEETLRERFCALQVTGSGYAELSHRDYLGAVLNLGVERDAVGDICVLSPNKAVLFCDRRMADFFTENLTRVARDTVRVTPAALPPDFDGGRHFVSVSDTVASPRADAVVAALCNLSREKAQALFREGRVELDYEPAEKPDREIAAGTVLTVRGYGKFIVNSLSEHTRKGRIRLDADKYV